VHSPPCHNARKRIDRYAQPFRYLKKRSEIGTALLVTDAMGVLRAFDFEDFERRMARLLRRHLWRSSLTIPAGKTLSYGGLAERMGKPKAVRAVGLANGANPVAIIVPCHRVIGADGSLTGYGGGLPRKQWLLDHEGARLRRMI
jgi:methylated-DNA-[protein]-cysteine S-methyltransferase